MTETSKTLTYVVIAAVMAAAGLILSPGGPKTNQDPTSSQIGTEFYPKFTSPGEATSIDVIGYDAATATASPFSVKYENGLWRIPTRHNYPADAKDRLAKVAASIIGLKREALAGRTEAEQAEFQTLDPQAEKAENLTGIGNRVTLKNGNTVLADYIIGKAVPNKAGYFYVRKPDEKPTYYAKVDLNLSTKFTDWIESDVLALEGARLSQIDIRKHTLEITREGVELTGEENNLLTRKSSSEPWALAGLDDAKEEVNQDEVRKLVSALDDLKIVGVRPKPESLKQNLADNEGIKLDQRTAEDLADRGFFFLRTQRGPRLVSREGDLYAGTDQGVEYEIRFGDAFDGTTEEIEFEFAKPKEETDQPADGAKAADEKSDADKPTGKKKSRYMFVTARVNPELFGPELVEPTKPEPPAEKPKDDEKPADDKKDDAKDEKSDEKKSPDDKPKDEKPAEEKPAEDSKEDPPVDPQKVYEDALKQYELDLTKYESDLKSRVAKLMEAEEKIKTLNARFAEWYYVISAENFENLRQGRSTLVKEKPAPEKPAEETDGEKPEDDAAEKQPENKKTEAKDPNSKTAAPKTSTPKAETPKANPPKADPKKK